MTTPSTPVSRRAVSAGLAWSVPAVAAAAAAPAFAASPASSTTQQCANDMPANAGPILPANGSRSVSSTGGGAGTNITSSFNYGMNDLGNTGSVTFKIYDAAIQTYVAQPYITLNNGARLCGGATLGATGSFVAPTGVNSSTAIMWYNSAGLTADSLWAGAVAHIPFIYYWTDPKTGTVHSAQYELLVTYPSPAGLSGIAQSTSYQIVKAPYGCTAQACSSNRPAITNVTPNYPKAGSTVTITGTNFSSATSVTYNGTRLAFTVDSPTQITATMPASWNGTTMSWGSVYDIVVCSGSNCSPGYGIARGA